MIKQAITLNLKNLTKLKHKKNKYKWQYWRLPYKRELLLINSKVCFSKIKYRKYNFQYKLKVKIKRKVWRRYKKISLLRKDLRSICFPILKFKPWEIPLPNTTIRSSWLEKAYDQYKSMAKNKSYSFLKTLVGHLLLNSHKETYNNIRWVIASELWKRYRFARVKISFDSAWQREVIKMSQSLCHSWWYDNLRHHVKESTRNTLNTSGLLKKLYQLFWIRDLREPWLSPLIFKRGLFSTMLQIKRKQNKETVQEMKLYTRIRGPMQTKRFRLYQQYEKLVYNPWMKGKLKTKKMARTYQIVGKIVSTFYGRLNRRQFQKIWKKTRKKKSSFHSHNDIFFSTFERRLDVLVYRLNFAPTILWARRLIWEGAIFVTNPEELHDWIQIYSNLKVHAFPLKLRDPKKLYYNECWIPIEWYSKPKFFLDPIQNENYLVQPNEIVQYNPAATPNKFKVHPFLYQKGIQKNFLSLTPQTEYWRWRTKSILELQLGKSRQDITQTNAVFLTFDPQHADLENREDRIKERFLSWVIF